MEFKKMIYLVRHGQTDWNIEKKLQGHMDIPLNENGKRQAELLAQSFSNLRIDRIISSDLLRARETAEIINKNFKKEISFDERIREINYGVLEGVSINNLTPDTWNIFNTNPEKLKAESNIHTYNRIKDFFNSLKGSEDNILIVTHGGALRMIMYYAENRDKFDTDEYLKNFINIEINNADIFEWGNKLKIYKKED